MPRSFLLLVSFLVTLGLAGCGDLPRDPINCQLTIELSGGLDGTYSYGYYQTSKGCSGTGDGEHFDIGLSQDDLPDMRIVVCGIGPAEVGDGLANLSIEHNGNTWTSADDWFYCGQGACPVTITVNDLHEMEEEPFTGGQYWVEGSGHCDQPLEGEYGEELEPIQVIGEFTFKGMPGLWE